MRKRLGIGAVALAVTAVAVSVAVAAIPGYKGQEGAAAAAYPAAEEGCRVQLHDRVP